MKDLFLEEFHDWIELNDWQFNPISFNGTVKYMWVNENCPSQLTTKELYDIFISESDLYLKIGDTVKVLYRFYGHEFEIGEVVSIIGKDINNSYLCRNEKGISWYLFDDEFEKIVL